MSNIKLSSYIIILIAFSSCEHISTTKMEMSVISQNKNTTLPNETYSEKTTPEAINREETTQKINYDYYDHISIKLNYSRKQICENILGLDDEKSILISAKISTPTKFTIISPSPIEDFKSSIEIPLFYVKQSNGNCSANEIINGSKEQIIGYVSDNSIEDDNFSVSLNAKYIDSKKLNLEQLKTILEASGYLANQALVSNVFKIIIPDVVSSDSTIHADLLKKTIRSKEEITFDIKVEKKTSILKLDTTQENYKIGEFTLEIQNEKWQSWNNKKPEAPTPSKFIDQFLCNQNDGCTNLSTKILNQTNTDNDNQSICRKVRYLLLENEIPIWDVENFIYHQFIISNNNTTRFLQENFDSLDKNSLNTRLKKILENFKEKIYDPYYLDNGCFNGKYILSENNILTRANLSELIKKFKGIQSDKLISSQKISLRHLIAFFKKINSNQVTQSYSGDFKEIFSNEYDLENLNNIKGNYVYDHGGCYTMTENNKWAVTFIQKNNSKTCNDNKCIFKTSYVTFDDRNKINDIDMLDMVKEDFERIKTKFHTNNNEKVNDKNKESAQIPTCENGMYPLLEKEFASPQTKKD